MIKNGKKLYIGFSKCVRTRVQEHLNRLSEGVHYCKDMQNDWNNDNSKFTICLVEKTNDKLREKYWTEFYCSNQIGYNVNSGSTRPDYIQSVINSKNTGRTRTKETKNRISKALKGKPPTSGTTGMKFSDATREKMKNSRIRFLNNQMEGI